MSHTFMHTGYFWMHLNIRMRHSKLLLYWLSGGGMRAGLHKQHSSWLIQEVLYTPPARAPGALRRTEGWRLSWWSCRLCGRLVNCPPELSVGLIRGPEEGLPRGGTRRRRRRGSCVMAVHFSHSERCKESSSIDCTYSLQATSCL